MDGCLLCVLSLVAKDNVCFLLLSLCCVSANLDWGIRGGPRKKVSGVVLETMDGRGVACFFLKT